MNSLTVAPVLSSFTKADVLARFLEDQNLHTTTYTISLPADVCLLPNGHTSAKLKYTTSALAQICRAMCPGLWKVICEISDLYQPGNTSGIQTAIRIFNTVINERFHLIDCRELVINEKLNTVEGILGPSYRYLANIELFNRLDSFIAGLELKLIDATVSSRKLMVCYAWSSPIDVKIGQNTDRYRSGFVLTNSETGECAITVKPVWIRLHNDYALIPRTNKYQRLVHVGKDFAKKLQKVLQTTTFEPIDSVTRNFIYRAQYLSKSRLDVNVSDQATKAEKRRKVHSFLTRHGLPKEIAGRIINGTSLRSAFDNNPISHLELLGDSLEGRSYYDLLISLIKEAKQLTYSYKDIAERAAYHLLTTLK